MDSIVAQIIRNDIRVLKKYLCNLNPQWDGRESIKRLKDVDYQWKQMEWIGFYFEYLCKENLLRTRKITIPGERRGTTLRVQFDALGVINWDFKAKAIKSDDHRAILNDTVAINETIKERGGYGIIMGLLDVEYNDENRTFQKWHTQLKGGLSEYEHRRIARTSISRYRKTRAQLQEILYIVITENIKEILGIHRQGQNSDGSPRKPKYIIDLEHIDTALIGRTSFLPG